VFGAPVGWGDPDEDGVGAAIQRRELLGKVHIPENCRQPLLRRSATKIDFYICGSTSLYAVYTSVQGALKAMTRIRGDVLGHTKIESTVRQLGIEVDDAARGHNQVDGSDRPRARADMLWPVRHQPLSGQIRTPPFLEKPELRWGITVDSAVISARNGVRSI